MAARLSHGPESPLSGRARLWDVPEEGLDRPNCHRDPHTHQQSNPADPERQQKVTGELGDRAVSARRASGRSFEFQVQANAVVDDVLLESLPPGHVTTVLPRSRSPTPADWEILDGQVTLTVGRCSDGEIASQVELDDHELRFGADDIDALTSAVLDAWQRRQESARDGSDDAPARRAGAPSWPGSVRV
jgi:hypothetical protein